MTTPAEALTAAIRSPKRGTLAIMPYLVAGYPSRDGFAETLTELSKVADAIELGVPFTDPMADGLTIQEASAKALEGGVSLRWIIQMLEQVELECPVVLMSYLNPLLAYGLRNLARDAVEVGVSGFIVPDLPFEEGDELEELCRQHGLARIQLVTPITGSDRMRRLTRESGGFVYAVTRTGITGGDVDSSSIGAYLDGITEVSPVPVCAGFGISTRADLDNLRDHADGAVIGSAVIRAIDAGHSPADFIRSLLPS